MTVLNAKACVVKTIVLIKVEKTPQIFRKHLISPKLIYKGKSTSLRTVGQSVQELSEKT